MILVIIEHKDIVPYLESRQLLKQYQKAKQFLLDGDQSRVQFKQHQPKNSGLWYFRINKQFRACGVFLVEGTFAISRIDNHQ